MEESLRLTGDQAVRSERDPSQNTTDLHDRVDHCRPVQRVYDGGSVRSGTKHRDPRADLMIALINQSLAAQLS